MNYANASALDYVDDEMLGQSVYSFVDIGCNLFHGFRERYPLASF